MKNKYRTILAASSILLLSACSMTTLNASWKNPDYVGYPKNIYIVGIAKQETHRRMFEDEFVRQLREKGVNAISSYSDLPNKADINEDRVTAKVQSHGSDAVLVASVTGRRQQQVVNPGTVTTYVRDFYDRPRYVSYGGFFNDYYSRQVIYEPATVTEFQIVTAETLLYDVKTKKLVWSAQLETTIDDNLDSLIKGFIKTVVKDLKDKGVI